MNESACNNFFEKHENMFKNIQFKFKGLKPKTEEGFTKLVKDLGAEVCDDSSYVFTDELYFKSDQNRGCPNLYNIIYIFDSIQAGKALDLSLYRFEYEKTEENVDFKEDLLDKKEKNEGFNHETNRLVSDKADMDKEKPNNVEPDLKEINSINKSVHSNPCDDNNLLAACYNVEKESKVEKIKEKCNLKDNTYCNIQREKSNSIDFNLKKDCEKNTNNSDNSDSSGSELMFDSEEEEKVYNNSKNWWQRQELSDKEICKIQSCAFEPERHHKHENPRRMMSLAEKRIILKYLIMTNSINQAKGIKVWCLMHDARYLIHRSVETLRNCFRRTIMPHIETYGLPPHILKKFLEIK